VLIGIVRMFCHRYSHPLLQQQLALNLLKKE
jgi:hypothetical protein